MSATFGRRECPICGCEFEATTSNARFCPPTERDRERAENSPARSWCAKAYDNALQRGRLEQLLDRVEQRGAGRQPFVCAHCGRRCLPGRDGIDEKATKFCSREHKAIWHREAGKDAA